MSAAPTSASGPPAPASADPQQPPATTPTPTPQPGAAETTEADAGGNLQSVLHLEPDTGSNADSDSAFDTNSSASTSLASSILHYEYSNGRRYHGFRQGSYVLPNDEKEQDRLDLVHHIFLLMLNGKLSDVPFQSPPKRVLDIGTGTGIWAIDFADENPGSEVLGTDLSPIQPTWIPPNAKFYIDDAESDWVYSAAEAFDLIHVRTLSGSIGDWDKLIQQSYTHLTPGGWLELNEPLALCESDDGTLEKTANLANWQELCNQAAQTFKKDIRVGDSLRQRMIDAGFVDVQEKVVKVPIGPWPKDPRMKEIGRYQRENMTMGIEPYTLGFFGKVLGWSEAECRVLIAKVIDDVRNKDYHLYIRYYFVVGRKPETAVH
ncbi:S-adenosyl-L-methionine-dependent methyltransferase [Cucurbitaria berberidis CBS 394.84]|uniref:S-adenosyl-L-methionine-dependent methyltransferase n=1 Tax=Cucurbitaria berberidis CBS 394.84 TaxID=1168544 RepID=A0A9P4G721_9PLEO|nr:S-adenosyl-L-methionine-dependent methyltransferase [Cucurbitaria berberidis CBS 394.84]KAF1840194.1 S-adenosyl-L-methionine-dependent methyltransferase [Cucurbitaria berberidis CBS 394.84]